MNDKLKFSKANIKLRKLQKILNKKVYSFSTLSGIACPFAKECLSWAEETKDGLRIKDGPHTKFRCYSASSEAQYLSTYKARKHNLDLLRKNWGKVSDLVNLIQRSLPKDAQIIRVGVAGDFSNQNVFDAWNEVAKLNPSVVFYTYTKSLSFWIKRIGKIAPNFKLTASYGGKLDHLIEKHNLKAAKVVFSYKEAKDLKLEVDHDDTHALKDKSFSLMIHGTQPPNSLASKALQLLKKGKV